MFISEVPKRLIIYIKVWVNMFLDKHYHYFCCLSHTDDLTIQPCTTSIPQSSAKEAGGVFSCTTVKFKIMFFSLPKKQGILANFLQCDNHARDYHLPLLLLHNAMSNLLLGKPMV